MALLRSNNENVQLLSQHVFGRNSEKVDTILKGPDISLIHMSVIWNNMYWEIIDYSRNGTFIDGQRLTAGEKVKLHVGQCITCGISGNISWYVEDLYPPKAMLLPLNESSLAIALNEFHFLYDDERIFASIYLSRNGEWMWEDGVSVRVLSDGDVVEVIDRSWKCVFPKKNEMTADVALSPSCGSSLIEFQVSQNEEHVSLLINFLGKNYDLGERSHHYSLLTLARLRIEDRKRGLDEHSQGWISVEHLSKMLGVDVAHLNTQLFRAKNQIFNETNSQIPVSHFIERRRGEVRFGDFPIKIKRGSTMEFQSHHHNA